jgi:hypothetical protein
VYAIRPRTHAATMAPMSAKQREAAMLKVPIEYRDLVAKHLANYDALQKVRRG